MNCIQMPEVMRIKYEKLFKVWSVYKNTLEDAEIMLKRKQNEFMNSLMKKQSNLYLKAKELLQTFLETAPISTEWNSNGKLKKCFINTTIFSILIITFYIFKHFNNKIQFRV